MSKLISFQNPKTCYIYFLTAQNIIHCQLLSPQGKIYMARYVTFLLLMSLISAVISTGIDIPPAQCNELLNATEEMVKANYFTFVMLINMSPLDPRILENVTFLMPNDRMLTKITIPQGGVSNFLLRHSIPSPLLYHQIEHVPTGSMIPSSDPDYMLSISNKGRRNFFLNNVKIISPNICTRGSSIRCHGIDGVLLASPDKPPLPTCSNSSSPAVEVTLPPPPAPLPSPAPPLDSETDQIPVVTVAAAPSPGLSPKKSGTSGPKSLSHRELLKFFLVSVVALSIC